MSILNFKTRITNVVMGLFILFCATGLRAQSGINTKSPQATLDVATSNDPGKPEGVIAPRITGEQLKAKDALYGAAQDGALVYVTTPLTSTTTSAKTAYVLDKGYYVFNATLGTDGEWRYMRRIKTDRISGGVLGSVYTGPPINLRSRNGVSERAEIISRTFNISRLSVLFVTFSVPVSNVSPYNGGILSDGASKLLSTNVWIKGPNDTAERILIRSASPFTNHGNAYVTGTYQLNASRTIFLPDAGEYTIRLEASIYAFDSTGVRADFCNNNSGDIDTVFDVFVEPLQGD